jgi:6-phosphogluconolactonase
MRAPDGNADVFPDLDALSHAAAEACVAAAREAVEARGSFALCLTGGSTPRPLYELLAGPYAPQVPWRKTHLFWGDERYVPHTRDGSNYGMARAALIDRVTVPEDQVHPMPTDRNDPGEAAEVYEKTLRGFADRRGAGAPLFDLLLLGLGADGHVCSLFPEDEPHQQWGGAWVRAPYGPPRHAPRRRLTLTLPALAKAQDTLFLISGEAKREAARAVLREGDPEAPATHVRVRRSVRWLLARAAAPSGMAR